MIRMMQVCSLVLLVAPLAAHAQQDPFLGTWKTNIAKSKYDPGPPPRYAPTIKRERVGNGVKVTVDGMDAQGKPTHSEYISNEDGKEVPVTGDPARDTVSVRRIGGARLQVSKKGGVVVGMSRQVASADGKTIQQVSIGVDTQGKTYHTVAVQDKQ